MARDLHDGHIHPRSHFCGSNCPKHKPQDGPEAAGQSEVTVRDVTISEYQVLVLGRAAQRAQGARACQDS